jgi:hypothetical protein
MLECLDYVYQVVFQNRNLFVVVYCLCISKYGGHVHFLGHTSLPSCVQVRRRRHRARVSCCGFLIDH